jgi:SEC-C motif
MRVKVKKHGRNDPCTCGSGKKYKKCHGRTPQDSPLVTDNPLERRVLEAVRLISGSNESKPPDAEYIKKFGYTRPLAAVDILGRKFVPIGNGFMWGPSRELKFFTDVLLSYVPLLFGREWCMGELAKPPGQRHPVIQWQDKAITIMGKQPRLADGSYRAPSSGQIAAYMTFAYDLYVVDRNLTLDERFLERLKNSGQFQGARHELFAEATCLRAGFKIKREDETDGSSRHAEFTATHEVTGEQISVEAKSKHRQGVLGRPGVRESDHQLNLRIGKLLNDAAAKDTKYPLVVFLDLNMPVESARRLLTGPEAPQFLTRPLERMAEEHGGRDPINLLILTNQPQHYADDEERGQHEHMVYVFSDLPMKPVNRDVLTQAVKLRAKVPQEWPAN